MDGFKHPRGPQQPPQSITPPPEHWVYPSSGTPVTPPSFQPPQPQQVPPMSPAPLPPQQEGQPQEPQEPSRKSKKRVVLLGLGGVIIAIIAVFVVGWLWFQAQLAPVDASNTERVVVTVEENVTTSEIATLLEEKEVIRSADAFSLYVRLFAPDTGLLAGSYRLSPSESTQQIVEHLSKGAVDTINITFLPGATLADHRDVLLKAGYSETEVDTAFEAEYDSVVFASKPDDMDLEGLIYGETYKVGTNMTARDVIAYTMQEFDSVVEENNLVEAYKKQGLTLYEGLTLASIIQREAIGGDEPQIAQVFFSRLAIDMKLGSDVTYQYIADKTGVERDINIDSEYNTRRYTGLPPGPISSPGLASLQAVASPAEGDYLYFLSGDDDVTYFGRTLEEHERNISEHCQQKCQII